MKCVHVGNVSELLSLWLMLVLCFCRSEEVTQNTLDVVKCGSVFRLVLPAGHHYIIQLLGTVVRLWHPVATLNRWYHLYFGHTLKQNRNSERMFDGLRQEWVSHPGPWGLQPCMFQFLPCSNTADLVIELALLSSAEAW